MKCNMMLLLVLLVALPTMIHGASKKPKVTAPGVMEPKTITPSADSSPQIAVPVKAESPSLPKKIVWEKEPTSILGMKLGYPLKEQIVACPTVEIKKGMEFPKLNEIESLCYQKSGFEDTGAANEYPLWNVPKIIPEGYYHYILIHNDIIEGFRLSIKHDDYKNIRELFITKYGTPTSIDESNYQNRSGAVYIGETLLWQGNKIYIYIKEYDESLDASRITVRTEAYDKYLSDRKKKKLSESLDKL